MRRGAPTNLSLGLRSPTPGPAACRCARSSRRGLQRDAGDFPGLGARSELSTPAAGAEEERHQLPAPTFPGGSSFLLATGCSADSVAGHPAWKSGRQRYHQWNEGRHPRHPYKIPRSALVGTWGMGRLRSVPLTGSRILDLRCSRSPLPPLGHRERPVGSEFWREGGGRTTGTQTPGRDRKPCF